MPDTVLDAGDTAGHSAGAKPRPFSRGSVRPTCVFPFEADILKLEGSMLHIFFFFSLLWRNQKLWQHWWACLPASQLNWQQPAQYRAGPFLLTFVPIPGHTCATSSTAEGLDVEWGRQEAQGWGAAGGHIPALHALWASFGFG